MRTAQRKAFEVAERERLLLRTALDVIARDGLHQLTLGRLAQEAGYSKGTVYNHFTCREDLLVELATESTRRQSRTFQAVADLPWSGVRALYGLAFAAMRHAETQPALFESSVTALTDAVAAAASGERLERRFLVDGQIAQIVASVARRTLREGDFSHPTLPAEVAADALRSAVLGYAVTHLLSRRFQWGDARARDSRPAVTSALVHGLGWPRLGAAELAEVQRAVEELIP
ncbi:TetR/AcrR family transcriptional regulator [Streptomyces sp. VRA16 Mangrove soil]|uniref:TetR/AcrR family transcriptional regulator n=1 Tax=Streptomyces sp. VRA16 Mangrove soil TaxID=2817434 RepID=UPI001A9E5DCB|nr:TetR/AcrR family transcriptional regulator [Streptomyces sp. VRA16 Mangrove soil]MBO1331451.1 TetR/AcrR family transcriptional regulator [Streptomyces sp. VRA16 Mangrove soil]